MNKHLILHWLITAIASITLLSSCGGTGKDDTQQPSNAYTASTMKFPLPERIRTSQAVNLEETRASLDTSAGPVNMRRVGNQFEGAISVPFGSDFTFELLIYEQVGNQRIIYVTSTGSTNEQVTGDVEIEISAGNYIEPDDDNDGASNLEERNAGSNHADPLSTPANPNGPGAVGQISFIDTTDQVEEGEQLLIPVARTGGTGGVVTASVTSSVFTGLTFSPQNLIWADGESGTKTVRVTADSNDVPGDGQTVQFSLTNATGGATIGNSQIDISIIDITIIAPPTFTPLASDGEWEVCIPPYNTTGPSPFATQLSANEGRIVSCVKACTENVILDPNFNGWAWMPVEQHSCTLVAGIPGSYTNVPLYTPRREQVTVNLSTENFIADNSTWACDTQSRANAEYSYVVSTDNLLWLQFDSDGTYQHAITTDGNPPPRYQGPNVWSVDGRVLELAHINTGYRNIIFFPGNQTFHIHPDTDGRLRCTRQQ